MNITLIGMAGAGKSYIGKRLAARLGFGWHDSDVELSKAFGGKNIQTILDELGEEKYLDAEANLAIEQTSGKDNLLISPAGSVVYVDRWINHLKSTSNIVYLKVPFELVEERLHKVPPRAIIGLGRKTLRELYDERHPLYEKHAHLTIDTHGRESDEILESIERFLNTKGN